MTLLLSLPTFYHRRHCCYSQIAEKNSAGGRFPLIVGKRVAGLHSPRNVERMAVGHRSPIVEKMAVDRRSPIVERMAVGRHSPIVERMAVGRHSPTNDELIFAGLRSHAIFGTKFVYDLHSTVAVMMFVSS
jgi:hypothetical protein